MKRDFHQSRRIPLILAAILVALGVSVMQGAAQQTLFKANPQKRDDPIKITSATLEVRDKQKVATFTGDVHAIQGDTDLRCAVLVVYYDSEQDGKQGAKQSSKSSKSSKQSSKSTASNSSDDRNNQKIRRMEARGSVIMTQRDQRAVGDHADFDVPGNIMVLTGNVVVTRGEEVLRGRLLHVDMTTGIYRMEADGGRVEVLISPKSGQAPSPPRPKRIN